MTNLSPEGRCLLRVAREEFEAGDGERARVDRALALRLGLATGAVAGLVSAKTAGAAVGSASVGGGLGAGGGVSAGGAGVAGLTGLMAGVKWLGVAVLVGAVGVGGLSVVRSSAGPSRAGPPEAVARAASGSSPIPPAAPAAHVMSTLAATLEVNPSTTDASAAAPLAAHNNDASATHAMTPQPVTDSRLATHAHALVDPSDADRAVGTPRSVGQAPVAPPAAPAAPRSAIADEVRLLRSADEALRDGNAPRAIELLHEHASRFSDGALTEERSVELVSALCRVGRVAEARKEAARFLRATPESPSAEAVRRSCGGSGLGERQ
jgi:hypothetical protein